MRYARLPTEAGPNQAKGSRRYGESFGLTSGGPDTLRVERLFYKSEFTELVRK